MCRISLDMWTEFNNDRAKTVTFITENMSISFKHEYRMPILTSRCDVSSDVVNIKSDFFYIISDNLCISDVKMTLSEIFRNFQNCHHFEVRIL